jgi:hypothetical protein
MGEDGEIKADDGLYPPTYQENKEWTRSQDANRSQGFPVGADGPKTLMDTMDFPGRKGKNRSGKAECYDS